MLNSNPTVKAALVVAAIAAFTLGCQTTTDPYTGEKKTTSTTLGALIGAGAGAAIGMISGHDAKQRRQRALVAAGGEEHPIASNSTERGRAATGGSK